MLTREKLSALAPGASIAGALRSSRVEWVRAKITDADTDRVRDVLGDDAASARIVPFVISTEGRASDGHILKMEGAILSRYEKNPRVFYSHNRWRPRIGDSVVWIEDTTMRALAAFLGRDLSEALDDGFSWALGELAALRGHAASIGFEILGAVPAPEAIRKEIPWALDVHSWALDEWSLVGVGADEDAISDGRAAGLDLDPLARAFARAIDELEAGGLERKALEKAWARAVDPGRPKVATLPERAEDAAPEAPDASPEPAPAERSDPPPADLSGSLRGTITALL